MSLYKITIYDKETTLCIVGGKPLPANVKSCIASWKRCMPDWEIIQWDESNFDINKFRWVREAVSMKRYAFEADFIRLYLLKNNGGDIGTPMYRY